MNKALILSSSAACFILGMGASRLIDAGSSPSKRDESPLAQPSQKSNGGSVSDILNSKDQLGMADVYNQFSEHQRRIVQQKLEHTIFEELMYNDPAHAASILEKMDPEVQTKFQNELVAQWSNEDPAATLQWLDRQKDSFADDDFQYYKVSTLCVLAKRTPAEAADFMDSISDIGAKEQLAIALADGWSKNNINEAFNLLKKLPDYGVSDNGLFDSYHVVMSEYSKTNPEGAFEIINNLESATLQRELVGPLVESLAHKNWDSALQKVLDLPHRSSFNAGINELVYQSGSEKSGEVLDVVMENQAKLKPDTIALAFERVGERYPQKGAEMLNDVPSNHQSMAAKALAQSWFATDEEAVIEWLAEQQNESIRSAGAAVVSRGIAHKDPMSAAKWASLVSDPAERDTLFSGAILSAEETQFKAMEKVITQLGIPSDEKGNLIEELYNRIDYVHSPLVVPSEE